ncbi:putative zinc transporter msc2 [Saxophila tyrrhenica]|uniref:Zinc transporter n=1 Tax=Saxophila tyrrhenica TaxID=1690608 RepID=A0AAV9P7H0_9PEZI|nr:putative zinc transporter msc2 [Saxophila tyrrhenica]
MASGYALPHAPAAGSHHGHTRSLSGVHLSPGKTLSNGFATSNGHSARKTASNSTLYTHEETSRETSPMPSPGDEYPAYEHNTAAVAHNHHSHAHKHTQSWSPMASRPRGESDLGNASYRTAGVTSATALTTLSSWLSLPEALTSLLVPLPYILASATFSSMSGRSAKEFPPLAVYEDAGLALEGDAAVSSTSTGIFETGMLTSGTLLAVGIAAKVLCAERMLDRRKQAPSSNASLSSLFSHAALQSMALRIASVALPYYASMQLGGARVGLVLLIALTVGLANTNTPMMPSLKSLSAAWSSQVATSVVMVIAYICDEAGVTISNSLSGIVLGYLTLIVSVMILPPPLPSGSGAQNASSSSTAHHRSLSASSPLQRSVGDVNITLAAGGVLAVFTGIASLISGAHMVLSASSLVLAVLTIASMASAIFLSTPSSLRSPSKAGLALGCFTTASCSFLYSPSLWPGTICNGGICALSFLSVLYDTNTDEKKHHHHNHHDHHDHHEQDGHHVHTHHHHERTEESYSTLTKYIMSRCEPGSLVYSILSEKDSRRIAYFTTLNFGFMLVQGAYGYISGSLGLLSDTVHMFFDCLGLVVGLGAAVASKWPTSPEKPYGWGKLNTLAGFGNGVFLMLVSVEFVWEAIEGIMEKHELRHVQELLVVSTLGLLVNMVGLFAFGHAHAGHDHGHSHSHGHHEKEHNHDHGHGHGHDHSHGHAHDHHHDHSHDHAHAHAPAHDHAHHDHNDNMHGIFLHVAADAGGSLAVIISTALTLWKPWYGWDPLATIIIAVLIFAAAVPLVVSSGQKLLLVVPESLEYSIKNTLQGLGDLRGVIGYAAPRFWLDDKEEGGDAHGHHHHGHDHGAPSGKQRVQGVIHVIAAPTADLEDVRKRVEEYTAERNMDLVIQVEREADSQCWCGGVSPRSS